MYAVKNTKYSDKKILSRIEDAKNFIRVVEAIYRLPAFTLTQRYEKTNQPIRKYGSMNLADLKHSLTVLFANNGMSDGEIAEAMELDRTSILNSRQTGRNRFQIQDPRFISFFQKIQGVWTSFVWEESLQNVNSPCQLKQPHEHPELLKRSA